jgi:hypothetical protein
MIVGVRVGIVDHLIARTNDMNKPVISDAVTAALQLGGVVLFEGGEDPFRAGPEAAALSALIKAFTKSKFSHSSVLPAGAPDIFESTIENGVSGPQQNNLAGTLASYGKGGGHAWIFNFLPQFTPDWLALTATGQHMIWERAGGKLPYDVKRLFSDAEMRSWVFDVVALPADGVIAYLGAHSKGIVCSEMVGLLLQGGGVESKAASAGVPWFPSIVPAGQPIGCSPQDVVNMPLFLPPVQLL